MLSDEHVFVLFNAGSTKRKSKYLVFYVTFLQLGLIFCKDVGHFDKIKNY